MDMSFYSLIPVNRVRTVNCLDTIIVENHGQYVYDPLPSGESFADSGPWLKTFIKGHLKKHEEKLKSQKKALKFKIQLSDLTSLDP